MSIVIITIPGEDKRIFANSLHKITNEQVDLVIIQRPKPNHYSLIERLKRLYKSVGFWALPREIFYAIRLRANEDLKNTLGYFRERSAQISESGYLPKILETVSVNGDDVYKILKELSPDLIVIWGSAIVKSHILTTAKKAINLHMGFCPYYRGAIANQRALMRREPERIGATIHYAETEVDKGDILLTIKADLSKSPRDLFRKLNDEAEKQYLNIARRLSSGENLPKQMQNTSLGETFPLKQWTPKTRYKLAKQILKWEKTGIL
ncbi:MAG: formyltransferase family protein [Patescibacteria group bacterium]